MQDQNDAELVAKALRKDDAAFETLVSRYHKVLFNVAHRMLGDYADAGDATQTAFIKAYRKLETFDPRYRFFSWIYRILLNECLNVQRGRKTFEPVDAALPADGTPLDALEASERRRRVQQALLQLPVEYRQVLVLRHFGELPYEEIAEVLNIEVKTVKSRLYTARQRLTSLLDGENRQ